VFHPLHSSLFASPFVYLRVLPSFPTRRSSDLRWRHQSIQNFLDEFFTTHRLKCIICFFLISECIGGFFAHIFSTSRTCAVSRIRSEEHTSELQSRENLVCRLLLEKKNKRELLD